MDIRFALRIILLIVCLKTAAGASNNASDPIRLIMAFGTGARTSFAYTKDFKNVLIGTLDGKVRLYDQTTGDSLLAYPETWKKPMIVRSNSGDLAALFSAPRENNPAVSGTVSIYKVNTGVLVRKVVTNLNIRGVAISGSDSVLLVAGENGKWARYGIYREDDIRTGAHLRSSLLFLSFDGTRAISCQYGPTYDTLYCSDLDTGRLVWVNDYPSLNSLDCYTKDTLLLVSRDGNYVDRINMINGGTEPILLHGFVASCCKPPPRTGDGRIVFSSHDTICIWNVTTDSLIARLKTASRTRGLIGFSPDGTKIITEDSSSNVLACWDASTGDSVGVYAPFGQGFFNEKICSLTQLSGDGGRVLSEVQCSTKIYPRLWDAATGRMLRTLWRSPSITHPRLSRDGNRLLVVPDIDTILMVDANDGTVIRTFLSGASALAKPVTSPYGPKIGNEQVRFLKGDSVIFYSFGVDSFLADRYTNRLSTRAICWNSSTGAIIKRIPPAYHPEFWPRIIPSCDLSKYITFVFKSYCQLYRSADDFMIATNNDGSYIAGISADLSLVLHQDRGKFNFSTATTRQCADSTLKNWEYCWFSPDNSMFLLTVSDSKGHSLRLVNDDDGFHEITSPNYEDIVNSPDNFFYDSRFSSDGSKLLVDFVYGQPCLYDISQLTSARKDAVIARKPGNTITLASVVHRRLRFTFPAQGIPIDPKAEFRIYSLSGKFLAAFPLVQFGQGRMAHIDVPHIISNGAYAYRFVQAGTGAHGRFILEP